MNKRAVFVLIVLLLIVAVCSTKMRKYKPPKTPPKPTESKGDNTQAFTYDPVLTPEVDKGINDALVGTTIYTSLPR